MQERDLTFVVTPLTGTHHHVVAGGDLIDFVVRDVPPQQGHLWLVWPESPIIGFPAVVYCICDTCRIAEGTLHAVCDAFYIQALRSVCRKNKVDPAIVKLFTDPSPARSNESKEQLYTRECDYYEAHARSFLLMPIDSIYALVFARQVCDVAQYLRTRTLQPHHRLDLIQKAIHSAALIISTSSRRTSYLS